MMGRIRIRSTTNKVDKRRQANGISPNFVHSLDATVMLLTVAYAKQKGIVDFAMVHDSFGTLAANYDQERDKYFSFNSIIIEKGAKLPSAKTNDYMLLGDTTSFTATVTQSDGPTENKEFVHVLAKESVEIKDGKKDDPIQVTFSYDKSQNMHCTFEHIPSGKKHEIQIKSMSSENVKVAEEQMKNFNIE